VSVRAGLAGRLPRALHPVAWWLWAIALATAASQTTNPLLLVLIFAVLGLVVTLRRTDAPWARGYRFYLFMALTVIAIRIVFRMVFESGVTPGEAILFRLPHIPTPSWYSGVQIGGAVTASGVLSASLDGARLACLLCCIGAANTLANPKRALRVLPGALYELGVAVTVALSVAPQLVESVQRVRRARQLRGASGGGRGGGWGGLHALRAIAIPVLHDALERSLRLAAGMDSRGYGRVGSAAKGGTAKGGAAKGGAAKGGATRASRRVTGALMLGGLAGLCLGAYGLLGSTEPGGLGVGGFGAGAGLCVAGLVLGGRRVSRSRYRPDPWRWPEWAVTGCGLACAVVLSLNLGAGQAALNPPVYPLHWPPLPVLPAVAILVAGLAAVLSPPPPVLAAPAGEPAPAARTAPELTGSGTAR
jgi:energy-coupling factor transport system permease protein